MSQNSSKTISHTVSFPKKTSILIHLMSRHRWVFYCKSLDLHLYHSLSGEGHISHLCSQFSRTSFSLGHFILLLTRKIFLWFIICAPSHLCPMLLRCGVDHRIQLEYLWKCVLFVVNPHNATLGGPFLSLLTLGLSVLRNGPPNTEASVSIVWAGVVPTALAEPSPNNKLPQNI